MNISGYTEAFSSVQQDSQTSKWCSYFKHILTGKKRENQMKKKFFRLSAAVLLFFSGIMEIGWRFFNIGGLLQKRGKEKGKKGNGFELSHIRDNHPETDMQRNMMRAGHGARLRRCRTVISRAWMD